MSVHSQSTASYETAATPEFPRHVVTAVVVSHDGARWLPDVLAGLLGQERPVQNAYAADTGSADDSARLVTEALGAERVLHLARRTGFGAAVEEAARTAPVLGPEELPYLKRPSGWDPVSRTWRDDSYDLPELPHGEPVQWLWLLHDDCAPEPDALAELLRVVDSNEHAVIVGPKLRGWYDRKQLLEVGVSIAHSGRRWTGLDRREQDQGQHDQVRPVLSVSSAGMLIRRDVWEELGGFDRGLPLMRDDVDLCWRAHAAGHTVLVAPDAAVRHAEAAARERRTVDCAGRSVVNPHRVDKAGAVYTMLVNSRPALLPYVVLRIVVGTLLRTVAYLVGKVPGQAVDEVMGLFGTLLRPGRILAARKRRGKSGVEASELRPLFPPPGATIRATVESVAGSLGAGAEDTGGSRHGAVESGPGGDDADFLEIEQFARLKKIARKPAPVLFALLLIVSLVACRNLLGGGSLMGGALLPAPDHVGSLWGRYADAWHPIGAGGTQSAPPYLAIIAVLSALCFGSTGFALTLLLVCSVPLAGLTAYFASRPLVASRQLRAWAAIAYAFLPAATGALAAGRLGTAVLAVLLPLIARAGVSAAGLRAEGARGSWRATWTYALLLTIAMAFTPVVWPVAVLLGLGVLALRRADITAYGLRFLAAVGTPVLMLAPWSLTLLTGPSGFLREAGLEYGDGSAGALDLLGASPGGAKTVGGLVLIGLVGAALAALLRSERTFAIRAAWVVALTGFLFAILSNRSAWAGPATLVYGLALLAAGAVGAENGRTRVAGHGFGWRQPVAALIALAAALGPVYSAANWMIGGADGPLKRRDPVQVPAFVAEESGTRDQARTLVLGGTSPAKVAYTLVRGSGGQLGDAELAASGGGDAGLGKVVSNLVAGSGADQSSQLSGYAVRYVLVRDGAPREFGRTLDATPGLSRLSQLDGSALWRVDRQVARAVIVPAKGGESLPVAADPVDIHTKVPAGEAGRVLRIADKAAPGWTATLDGKALKKSTVDGWAQGFELPADAGKLDVTYDAPLTHTLWIWAQVALALVLFVLALPGRRRRIDDDLPEAEELIAAVPTQPVPGEGRRARRLRAQAEAEAVEPPDGEQAAQGAELPAQPAYGEWDAAQYATTSPAGAAEHDQQAQQGYDPYQQQYPGYQQYPEGQYPEAQYTEAQYTDGRHPDGQYVQAPEGQAPNGQYPEGQYPEGQYSDGQYAPAPYPEQQAYPDSGYPQVPGAEGQFGQGQYADGQPRQGYDPYRQPGAEELPPEGQYDPYGYGYPPPEHPDQQPPHRPDGSQQ
ncbi:family 2 glycosyl transferase [Streptomyces sp. CB01201]|uniref:glycosyltransferase family 2 protein n=1 Tax=Streptomyces sp. CB01201 TaxID=2020324 RepID=UPI000C27B42E|nr:glycosyltransferase family 2 protein [Streptomyces sp. CB01201]PJN04257.1 family 2 glycosyl transferase [Streptomyces sp. CB01201]